MKLTTIYKGKLSYTIAVISIIWAIVGFIFGWLETIEAGELILIGLGVFGIRRNMQ